MRVAVILGLLLLWLAEIFVLVQVGQLVGLWWTLLLVIATGVLGGWLVKRELRSTWRSLQVATQEGRIPSRELADGAVVALGGLLLLLPGFITDVVGLLLLLPFVRPAVRRVVVALGVRQAHASAQRFAEAQQAAMAASMSWPPRGAAGGPFGFGGPGGGPVVQGEVVDDGPGSSSTGGARAPDGQHPPLGR